MVKLGRPSVIISLICSMREKALTIFKAAIKSVQPSQLLPENIQIRDNQLLLKDQSFSLKDIGSIYVIGAGKAAAAMAFETEKILDAHIEKGIVVTKYGHSL